MAVGQATADEVGELPFAQLKLVASYTPPDGVPPEGHEMTCEITQDETGITINGSQNFMHIYNPGVHRHSVEFNGQADLVSINQIPDGITSYRLLMPTASGSGWELVAPGNGRLCGEVKYAELVIVFDSAGEFLGIETHSIRLVDERTGQDAWLSGLGWYVDFPGTQIHLLSVMD
ncbi:hypothetical protein ACFL5Z_00190 [Planctomycetota bacterium]